MEESNDAVPLFCLGTTAFVVVVAPAPRVEVVGVHLEDEPGPPALAGFPQIPSYRSAEQMKDPRAEDGDDKREDGESERYCNGEHLWYAATLLGGAMA